VHSRSVLAGSQNISCGTCIYRKLSYSESTERVAGSFATCSATVLLPSAGSKSGDPGRMFRRRYPRMPCGRTRSGEKLPRATTTASASSRPWAYDAGDMSALHVEPADDAAVGEANTEGCGFGGKRTGYLKQSPVSSFGVSSQPTIFSRTCFNAGSTRMQPSGSSTS
jgi:hypothetical protein